MKIKRDKYDVIWSQKVRERDGRCKKCGNAGKLDAHHIFTRSAAPTRYLLENGVSLCFQCHTANFNFSAHKTPEAFKKWLKKSYGYDIYKKMEKIAKHPKFSMSRERARKAFEESLSSA